MHVGVCESLKHCGLGHSSLMRPIRFVVTLALIALVLVFSVPSSAAVSEAPAAEWSQIYSDLQVSSVIQTSDGGYAIAGTLGLGFEAVLIKTDIAGELQWRKSYGYDVFGGYNSIVSVVQTMDLSYVLFGEGGHIVKTDAEGNVQWSKSSGLTGVRVGIETVYGRYVLVGNMWSDGQDTAWILKTDRAANILWTRNFTGGYTAYTVAETFDGGCIVAGSYKDKFWCAKLNLNGSPEWSRVYSYGGPEDAQHVTHVIGTSDGEFVLAGIGEWQVSGGNVPWLIKIDSRGYEQWCRNYEDMPFNGFVSVVQVEDGGYVAALSSSLTLVKVNDLGDMLWYASYETPLRAYAGTASFVRTIDGGFAIAGSVILDSWFIKIAPEAGLYPTTVSILSPENKTYSTGEVPLTFTVSKFASWIGYSLNGQANVTIAGNTTLTELDNGLHRVTVYVNGTFGAGVASDTVYFSVAKPLPMEWFVVPAVIGVVVCVCLLIYFKKLKVTKQTIVKIMDNNIVRSLTIIGLCVLLGFSQIFFPFFFYSSSSTRANPSFQVGVSYVYEYDKIGQIYYEVARIHSLGFKVIRVNLVCDSSDPSHLSNSLTAEFIMAAQHFNLDVALIIHQHDGIDDVRYYLERWGNAISYIQVLNEPELSASWDVGALYTDDELFTKFQQIYTVIEPYRSTAKFYTNFEAGFLLRPNVPAELSRYLDFVGYDVFMESFLTLSPRMVQLLHKITNKEVVISEFGMSTSDDTAQADFIIRGLNLFKNMGLSGCWIVYWNSVDNVYGIRGRLAEQKVGEWIAQNS